MNKTFTPPERHQQNSNTRMSHLLGWEDLMSGTFSTVIDEVTMIPVGTA